MKRKHGIVELEGVHVLRQSKRARLSFYTDVQWSKIVALLPRPADDNDALRIEIDAAIFAMHVCEHVPLGEEIKQLGATLSALQGAWDSRERLAGETVKALRELEDHLQRDLRKLEKTKRRPAANDPLFASFVDTLIEVWIRCGGHPGQTPTGPLARFLLAATAPIRPQTPAQLVRAVRRHLAN